MACKIVPVLVVYARMVCKMVEKPFVVILSVNFCLLLRINETSLLLIITSVSLVEFVLCPLPLGFQYISVIEAFEMFFRITLSIIIT